MLKEPLPLPTDTSTAMATAVERVLGITELVEQIVLALGTTNTTWQKFFTSQLRFQHFEIFSEPQVPSMNDGSNADNTSTVIIPGMMRKKRGGSRRLNVTISDSEAAILEQLFTLQRVNKMFNATIANSLPVQRRMMLAHEDEGNQVRPFGMEYAFQQQPGRPFIRSKYHNDLRNAVNINLQPVKYFMISVMDLDFNKPMPMIDHGPFPENSGGMQPSWRKIKLCNHPQPVMVHLSMIIESGVSYMSMLAFDEGTETLAMLSDGVMKVLGRSREEHMRYMKEYRAMSALFDNEPVMRWRRARRGTTTMSEHPKVLELLEAQRLHSLRTNCGRVDGTCAFCARWSEG